MNLAGGLGSHQLLELIPDALVVIRSDCRMVFANEQAVRLFGYPQEELLGEPIGMLTPESRDSQQRIDAEEYFADPRTRSTGMRLELAGRRKDGSEFAADVSLFAREGRDGVFGAVSIRGLSHRSEAKSALPAREADALEAREQQVGRLESIGELAGGIAHDFNNLLAVIRGNSELALGGAGESGGIPEDEAGFIREELEEVQDAADHAAKLTSQLLVFSRRETTAREPVDLNAVVSEIEQLLQRSIGDHIHLVTELASDLPLVLADRNQMEQILFNLAINARDAMTAGGKLTIVTTVAELDEEYTSSRPDVSPGTYVRLIVADTGIGMPPEVAARAFEPFFSTKSKGQATGLGLATVYGIVKSSGGHASIYSEEGSGTAIRVHLPLADPTLVPDAGPKVADVNHPGAGETILVVEDADRVRRTVTRVLERGGYEVVGARDGDHALEIIGRGDIEVDLLLTDVEMPGMGGAELGAKVKAIRPNVPILYMSGYAGVSTPVVARDILIEKPFTIAKILGRVAQELQSSSL